MSKMNVGQLVAPNVMWMTALHCSFFRSQAAPAMAPVLPYKPHCAGEVANSHLSNSLFTLTGTPTLVSGRTPIFQTPILFVRAQSLQRLI